MTPFSIAPDWTIITLKIETAILGGSLVQTYQVNGFLLNRLYTENGFNNGYSSLPEFLDRTDELTREKFLSVVLPKATRKEIRFEWTHIPKQLSY